MKAVGYSTSKSITEDGALLDITLDKPQAEGRDLLVKVNAVSVNPVDTKVRMRAEPEAGQYKVLGWDCVGEVVETGAGVTSFKVGDQVWYAGDITRPGTNSEYHLVDERIVGCKPQSISNAQAAAVPLTAITAWELLFERLDFTPVKSAEQKNQQILIIGAAGGVGSILVQLAAQLTDATVIGTASRPESEAWVKALGADLVINHSKPLSEELKAKGINSVTHVISLNHTDQHFDEIVASLAPFGKLAMIDDPQEPLDILKLKTKSLSLHWELMFTHSMFKTTEMGSQGELLNKVSQLIDDGKLKTTLGKSFGNINADNVTRAHAFIEGGSSIGKVVLEGF